MGPYLSVWLSLTHLVMSEVQDVTFASLIVTESSLPRVKVAAVVLRHRAREQVQTVVVVPHKVEIQVVLPLTGELRKERLVASVVAFQSVHTSEVRSRTYSLKMDRD